MEGVKICRHQKFDYFFPNQGPDPQLPSLVLLGDKASTSICSTQKWETGTLCKPHRNQFYWTIVKCHQFDHWCQVTASFLLPPPFKTEKSRLWKFIFTLHSQQVFIVESPPIRAEFGRKPQKKIGQTWQQNDELLFGKKTWKTSQGFNY